MLSGGSQDALPCTTKGVSLLEWAPAWLLPTQATFKLSISGSWGPGGSGSLSLALVGLGHLSRDVLLR